MRKPTRIGKVHCIIPDCQVRPGVPTEHLTWIGNYIAEKKPDVIINLADFADMPSLNYHGRALELEGKRYTDDIQAAREAMAKLLKPIRKVKRYRPRMVLTLGNHEQRIENAVKDFPKFKGVISIKDLKYAEAGWEVYPFLKVVKVDGIEYVHYFTSGVMGKPVSSAAAILRERHCSGVMGHIQVVDVAFHKKSGHFGMFAGCCYLHEEEYLTPQMEGSAQRRQIVFLHEVQNGIADPMFISLEFLRRKYS